MNIDKQLLDNLTAQAKASLRLRVHLDLRDSVDDQSQRMLNALEPGTMLPIHRHRKTAETVVILRGRAVQYLYDAEGKLTESVLLAPMSLGEEFVTDSSKPRDDVETGKSARQVETAVPAMQVEKGQWHRLECLESGTVIVEFKNGVFEPLGEEDLMKNVLTDSFVIGASVMCSNCIGTVVK